MDHRLTKEELAGALEESQASERTLLTRLAELERGKGELEAKIAGETAALAWASDQLADASEKCGRLEQELRQAVNRQVGAENEAQRWQKEAKKADDLADMLREQLHGMTIANARAQGYRERVEKFDPVSEQQRYADGGRHGMHSGSSGILTRANEQAQAAGSTAWYRQRA